MNPTQTSPQPDLQALALTKAIRAKESGGNYNASGDNATSTGAYQYQPATWKQYAGQILGDQNAAMTPENQNAVTYGMVKTWKDAGMGPAEIAAKWNSGSATGWENKVGTTTINGKAIPYNTPQYVSDVVGNFKSIFPQVQAQYGQGSSSSQNANTITGDNSSPSVSGFVGNVFKSAGNLVGGLAQAAMHPIDTLTNILGMGAGGAERAYGAATGQNIDNADTQKFDGLVGYLKDRYGGDSLSQVMGHIGHSAYTDPVGVALDVSTILDGVGAGIGAAGKVAKISEMSKAADLIKQASELVNPIAAGAKVARPAVNVGVAATRSIASHLFSLSDPASVTAVLENPSLFAKGSAETINRSSLAEDFGKSLDQLHGAVQEGGMAYRTIADGNQIIKAPENWIQDVLAKGSSVVDETGTPSKAIPFGLKLDTAADGSLKVSADTNSFTRNPSDIAAIQNFLNTWGNKTEFTPKEFLNMRQDLSSMSKFGKDIGRNDAAELVSKALRADANKTMRPNINGLKALDDTQAPIIRQYAQAKKDFLTMGPEGYEFKPGAINKIANATGKGKDILLQRMEQLSPGITKRIQILKAIEDWESAGKAKVGSYARGIIEGGGIITMNPTAIAAAIIMNPAIALPLMRGLGWSAAKMKPLIELLKKVVNTSNLRYPAEAGKISGSTTSQSQKPTDQLPVSQSQSR